MSTDSDNVPQWKKELIARLRSQNKLHAIAGGQLVDPLSVQSSTSTSSVQQPIVERCDSKMVQERCWDEPSQKSDSDEDLHYGPGIVNKLKERYLSLAQRETKTRPSILRKAASLENILDDAPNTGANRLFQTRLNGSNDVKNATNRYRSQKRGSELKRARSVETISSAEDRKEESAKRESLHEEMLISNKEGSDKPVPLIDKKNENDSKGYTQRVNRPKRIPPVMNEKEKPPVDVVKQAKMIFERRPEQRTRPPHHTGEVAAKVATYKNIIVQAKASKKPAIKVKPVLDKSKTNGIRIKTTTTAITPKPLPEVDKSNKIIQTKIENTTKSIDIQSEKSIVKTPPPNSLPSPIPDISRNEENGSKTSSLSETPDLIITSSPIPAVNSPSYRISATENFLKEEIRHASDNIFKKPPSPSNRNPNTTFFFTKNSTPVNKNILNTQTPPTQELKLEINGVNGDKKPNLTILEIEKNLINTAKSLGVSKNKSDEVTVSKVPKVKKRSEQVENNSIVFKFTDRKDVPDYVQNDGVKRVAKLEKPKVGEGGIILLPGASIGESFTDEDEEILRSLERPPSPCDVTFINDNILIDGKSSLSQKTKKSKMKISFVEEGPEVYEYPSENSLLIEDISTTLSNAQMGHSVPSLTGTSSLANYTPKSTEEFQPGITRSLQNAPISKPETPLLTELVLQEAEKPIVFSAGANSDILF